MFRDEQISIVKVGTELPKLSPAGMSSFAEFLDLSRSTIAQLDRHHLVEAILKELDQRGTKEVTMRYYKDAPVGIPGANTLASIINEKLKALGLEDVKAPFTTVPMEHLHQEPIDLLPSDAFKIGYSASVDTLDQSVYLSASLLRMVCTNKAMIPERRLTRTIDLDKFKPYTDQQLDSFRDQVLDSVRVMVSKASSTPISVQKLFTVSAIAHRIGNDGLKHICEEKLRHAIDRYETPKPVKKLEDLKRMPQSWQETAVLKDMSTYDLWNHCTSAITIGAQAGAIDPENALRAHIDTSKMLTTKIREYVIAQPKR